MEKFKRSIHNSVKGLLKKGDLFVSSSNSLKITSDERTAAMQSAKAAELKKPVKVVVVNLPPAAVPEEESANVADEEAAARATEIATIQARMLLTTSSLISDYAKLADITGCAREATCAIYMYDIFDNSPDFAFIPEYAAARAPGKPKTLVNANDAKGFMQMLSLKIFEGFAKSGTVKTLEQRRIKEGNFKKE